MVGVDFPGVVVVVVYTLARESTVLYCPVLGLAVALPPFSALQESRLLLQPSDNFHN